MPDLSLQDHPVHRRLTAPGPKRILSLDGGGIRGAITVAILAQLEAQLRRRHARPDLRLCDYFDLIGGTSTGSIIAALLAIGKEVAEIKDAYGSLGDKIFEHPARWWQIPKLLRQNLFFKNRPAVIEGQLQSYFEVPGEGRQYLLGDERLRTGLCIVAKRVDTFSVWHLHNNPLGRYYAANRDIPLWRLVRASSAAPTFFPPTIMPYDNAGHIGAFIDGGVSAFNNPAMQLYLMATLKGYHLEWPSGDDKLLVVSVGTGTSTIRYAPEEVRKLGSKSALFWGATVPDMFIRDCGDYNELLLQGLGTSPTRRKIDSEVGDLAGDFIAAQPQFHYLRYNATITDQEIAAAQQRSAQDPKRYPPVDSVKDMMQMDRGNHVDHLLAIGQGAAAAQLSESLFEAHFPRTFDLPNPA